MNIRYPIYEGVYRILTFNISFENLRFLLFYFVTFARLSRICYLHSSAGRLAPLHGADGEADRREFPMFRKA